MLGTAKGGRENERPALKEMSPRNQQKARALGLTSATGLVIGSIIGTGVFTMPAVLAGAGTSSLLVLVVIAIGAMLLAVLFGQLTKRVPNSDGGLYAYARHEFGDFAGYLTGWCYWIQAWAGNAAIVASWVFYVDALFGINHPSGMDELGHRAARPVGARRDQPGRSAADGLVPERHRGAEVPAAAVRRRRRLVLRHERQLRRVQRLGRQPLQRHRHRRRRRAVLLHRRRGRGRHRQAGQGPAQERGPRLPARHRGQRHPVPGRDGRGDGPGAAPRPGQQRRAVRQRLPDDLHRTARGPGSWSPPLAVVSGIGALNGWTLVTTEVARAAASDGLFPRPFAWTDRKDTAWFGIVVGSRCCPRCSCCGATPPAPG